MAIEATSPRAEVTGCILAGGRGRRFGGADKGLLELHGQPLIRHVLRRLQPQVTTTVINANRNLTHYQALGIPVLTDASDDFAGPLAGCLAALRHATTQYVVIVPCDSPFLPPDLVERLWRAGSVAQAEICAVHCAGRLQPVFALIATRLAESLAAYLGAGGRKIDAWYRAHHLLEVDFEADSAAFMNINDASDLDSAERRVIADAARA